MAESRGSLLAKSVQKHAGRAKEKLLQNLGKVDRTADEIFDEHLQNFIRQQNCANRLQKEFSNYIRCIRAAQAASKSLMEAIGDTYESQWTGHDLLYVQCQSVDMLWQDFSHKLADQVLLPLNTYQQQFPEMRKKIDKRGRKLVDYDGQRHNFQALQTNMKKRDEAKIAKGREQLEEAKRTYEILNSELHDELPALHDSRILFLVTSLQSLFNAEHTFHSETSKVFEELEAIVDKLATDSQRGSYSVKKSNGAATTNYNNSSLIINNISPNKPTTIPEPLNIAQKTPAKSEDRDEIPSPTQSPSPPTTPPSIINNVKIFKSEPKTEIITSNGIEDKEKIKPFEPADKVEKIITQNGSVDTEAENVDGVGKRKSPSPEPPSSPRTKFNNNNNPAASNTTSNSTTTTSTTSTTAGAAVVTAATEIPTTTSTTNENDNTKKSDEVYDIPAGASTDNLPPGVLYKVKATYKYNREDVDELSFEVGEIIHVIEYEDPDEQEEGWLMGLKEGTGEKGMFPANFTRPI